jgi:hypothetical protein
MDTLSEFVPFGDVARGQLKEQCQYASRYTGTSKAGPSRWTDEGYPNLGQGLRFRGSSDDYHGLEIHQGDVPVFVARYKAHAGQQVVRRKTEGPPAVPRT